MSSAETSMQSYYASRAPEYDHVYQKPERQADLRLLQKNLPALLAGSRVLEIACGTGFWTQFFAPVAIEVVAFDSSPETLAIAKTRVPQDKVKFLVGDAYCLPKSEGKFNAAFAGFWFSHIPKARRREFLTSLACLLEPGATVVFLDNVFAPGSSTPISAEDQDGNTYQTRVLADGSAHRILKNFPSEPELRSLVADLGTLVQFTRLEYFWLLQYTVASR